MSVKGQSEMLQMCSHLRNHMLGNVSMVAGVHADVQDTKAMCMCPACCQTLSRSARKLCQAHHAQYLADWGVRQLGPLQG